MGRKRTILPNGAEAEIRLRTERHESAATIFQALHGTVNKSTIVRRQFEIRNGTAPTSIPSPAPTPKPKTTLTAPEKTTEAADVPEEVPADTPLETIDKWIERVERGAAAAEKAGNLPALSSLAMRAASLAEARRKATPIPKADPNDNPDYQALAAQGEARLHALVNELFRPTSAP